MNTIKVCWKNKTKANSFEEITDLKEYWENPRKVDTQWKAPDGLFWTCGGKAYNKLGKKLKGTCTIGIIQPAFFLLPGNKGSYLDRPL
ncbi:ENR1 protein, partial [Regulus satrapa]|nr:ENR1 protein [Regulus satrapa]